MEGALLGLLQRTFGKIVCKLCHSRLMVFSLVNVFLKHSTSFPSPHARMILADKLYHSIFSMKIYWPSFFPFPVIIIILFGISHWWTFPPLPFLGTLLIGTLSPFPPFYLLIGPCWWSRPPTSLLLGEDHLSIHAPHPIPPIYGDTLLENSIPNSFFWTDLIATFLHVY